MWAGGRLEFIAPLRLGEAVTRTSTILSVTPKSGKCGNLVFVTVKHELSGESGLAVVEEQDLVYRDAATRAIPVPGAVGPITETTWRETVNPYRSEERPVGQGGVTTVRFRCSAVHLKK